jgi:hypothetical protein
MLQVKFHKATPSGEIVLELDNEAQELSFADAADLQAVTDWQASQAWQIA